MTAAELEWRKGTAERGMQEQCGANAASQGFEVPQFLECPPLSPERSVPFGSLGFWGVKIAGLAVKAHCFFGA